MRYVIAVKSPIFSSQGSTLAYQFAEQLIAQGEQIDQIFFFQNGVDNANKLVNPASDEVNLLKNWQNLAQSHCLSLHLCISAAQRRGIVDESTTPISEQTNLAEGFVLAGLGEFTQATLKADRLITF